MLFSTVAMASENEKTIEKLAELYEKYINDPDSFGAEEIVSTYSCYTEHMAQKFIEYINTCQDKERYWEGKAKVGGDMAFVTQVGAVLKDWTLGNITDKECIKTIMAFVNLELMMGGVGS